MYKKLLLSYTTTAAIVLFNIQFNAHAKTLEGSEGKQDVSTQTYETIHAKTGGQITGKHLTVVGNQDTNSSVNKSVYAVTAEGANSAIVLLDGTTIKGTDSDINLGLEAKDGATLQMTGGSITVSDTGALFWKNNNKESKLKDVAVSSGKDEAPLKFGVIADKNGIVTLENVKVTQTLNGIVADDNSTITVSGGTFETKGATISAQNGGTITLTGNAQITSSENAGLIAKDNGVIKTTGGTITAFQAGALFLNSKSNENKLEDVAISKSKDKPLMFFGIATSESTVALKNVTVTQTNNGIVANDNSTITVSGGSFKTKGTTISSQNGSTVILTDNARIASSEDTGLLAKDNSVIKMTGGTITDSKAGALFFNSKSNENKLEDVAISSGQNEAALLFGVKADKESTVALKNVKVTQANNGIVAYDNSTITVSGGSFETKGTTISSQHDSTITLTDNVQITSSEDVGLYAHDNSTIKMTGGNVTGKDIALAITQGGHITATDVVLKTSNNGIGAVSNDSDSVIELLGNTTISDTIIGLEAKNGGAISMTGGIITNSDIGAGFDNSKRNENKLENVTISSGKDEELLIVGIVADKESTVALKNVKVTQANVAVAAEDHSTITISGGSFYAKGATIAATEGGTIILTDNAQIISSDSHRFDRFYAGLYANGLDSTITMTKGSVTGERRALAAEEGGHITVTDVNLTTAKGFSGSGANAINPDSVIELYGTTINDAWIGLHAEDGGVIKMIGGTIKTSTAGATFSRSESDENKLENVTISSNGKDNSFLFIGLNSQASNVALKDVRITNAFISVYAMNHSQITISGGSFTGNKDGLHVESGSTLTLTDNAQITSSEGNGLYVEDLDSTITMTGGTVTAKEAAFVVKNSGHIDITNVSATAENNGIKFENSNENTSSEVNLTNAKLHIKDGIGMNVDESIGTVNLGENSEIRADVLLLNKASTKENALAFTLNADNSVLEGRARIINSPKTIFNLKNNTTWFLKTSANEKGDDGKLLDIAQRSRSDISALNLDNSSIIFNEPVEDHYHTLHIGSGHIGSGKSDTPVVYNATGDAKIYFNTAWSDGTAIADQKTDRLLIHGDVSGSTTVYIKSDLGDEKSVENAATPSNTGGLSLIQVSGKAKEDSFKLANGYTTVKGQPYKYTLTAYGPQSSYGKANIEQNLFDEKKENFWDFRLHKAFLDPAPGSNAGSNSGSNAGSKPDALVPQMASYLVMPNALFTTGLTDMAKQNALLANMRTSVLGKEDDKTRFFLHTYGSTGTLSSERGPREYGYGADIRYAALQGGVTLTALEGQNTSTHFGVVGTYGQLSFTPKDMQDAGKNTFDKWSLTAYSSMQHDNGFYLDTLLSYGALKGDITNAIIGKTAKLKNTKMLSISTTVGKQFATSVEGLSFEPQAQLAYQNLMFDTLVDVDNFKVDMNNPHQWLIRVGGRLSKTIVTAENGRSLSFYGKVNAIKTFGDAEAIHVDKNYQLDPMGSLLEGGVGISAQLSQSVSLRGDISYQQKLQKTGITGTSFSGGIRYQF